MMFIKFLPDGTISQEILEKGHHYVEVALNEVPLFIRKGKAIPVADVAQTVKDINPTTIRMIGYEGAEYDRYDDDGVSTVSVSYKHLTLPTTLSQCSSRWSPVH